MTTTPPPSPRGPSADQPDALPPTTAQTAERVPAADRASLWPADCGHAVTAHPPSYDAWCDVCEAHVGVLTALTDPTNFRADWVQEDER